MEYRVLGLLLFPAIAGAFDLITEPEKKVLNLGDNIVLPCQVTTDGYESLKNPITFYKGKEKYDVTRSATVEPPFKATGRYELTYNGTANNEFYLHITGVTAADGGEYTCQVADGDQTKSVTHTVVIVAPIKSINLTGDQTDDDKLIIDAGKPSTITCEMIGGHPKPTVKVFQGDVDVTDQFQTNDTPDVSKGEGNGLEVTEYHTTMTNSDFLPSTNSNGEKLKCEAVVDLEEETIDKLGIDGLEISKTLTLEIRFAPEIDCVHKESDMDQQHMVVECVVRAYPEIDKETVTWSFGPEDNKTTLEYKGKKDDYESTTSDDETNGEVTVTLHIYNVEKNDFQKYSLKVSNAVGTKTHDIDVQKTTTLKPDDKVTESPEAKGSMTGCGDITHITVLSMVVSILAAIYTL